MASIWTSIQNATANVLQSAQEGYSNMVSYPESAQCTKCMTTTLVPASTFAWACKNGHQNTPLDANCTQCPSSKSESKKLGLYQPKIVCSNSSCAEPILLSETTIANNLWSAMVTAPRSIEKVATQAVQGAKELAAPPTIFSCRYCNSQLYTPTGPWTCFFDNCNTNNPAGTQQCTVCNVNRFSSGVVCAICNRSTPVPSIKLFSEVESAFNNVHNAATSTFQYASGNTTANCLTCMNILSLDKEQVRLILGLGPTDPVPGFDDVKAKAAPSDAPATNADGTKRTQDEEEIFAKLNEEEAPLASAQPSDGSTRQPTPQDILCQKCLHLNTISQDQLISRQLSKQRQQQEAAIPPTPEELERQQQQQQQTQHVLSVHHFDENGNPIKCVHCSQESNIIQPVVPCQTCHLCYCRSCAPYSRSGKLYCFGCATAYDAQQQSQQGQQQQQATAAAVPAPVADSAPAADAAPAPQDDPYEALS